MKPALGHFLPDYTCTESPVRLQNCRAQPWLAYSPREQFSPVQEDFMLLAVGVIAASAFVQSHACWSQVGALGVTAETPAEVVSLVLGLGRGSRPRTGPRVGRLAGLECSLYCCPWR